jgi:hypothetical protein
MMKTRVLVTIALLCMAGTLAEAAVADPKYGPGTSARRAHWTYFGFVMGTN